MDKYEPLIKAIVAKATMENPLNQKLRETMRSYILFANSDSEKAYNMLSSFIGSDLYLSLTQEIDNSEDKAFVLIDVIPTPTSKGSLGLDKLNLPVNLYTKEFQEILDENENDPNGMEQELDEFYQNQIIPNFLN